MAITAAELVVAFSADPRPAVDAIDQVGRKMEDTARQAEQAAGVALGAFGAGVGLMMKDFVGTAANFEQQIANVAAVGGADAQANLQAIKDAALEMGASTAFSASEAAAGMEEMIKAGMSVKDVLGGAAQAALDLSAASGTDVALAAEIMSNALNVFGDTMTDFDTAGEKAVHIADLLAQAANASATDVKDLGYALSMSSAVLRNFGVDVDTATTALAILAQNGLKSSDAGTSLKQMLLSIANMSKPAKEALIELGLSAEDLVGPDGQFIGIEKMFELFRKGAAEAGLGEMDISRILGKIFGSDATRAASIFFRTNEEGWAGMRDGMANAGTAGTIAEARLDTFQGAMEALSGSIETLKIQFGQALLPALTAFAKGMMGVVNAFVSLPQGVKNAITAVTVLGGGIAAAAGAWILFGGQIKLVLAGLMALSPWLLAAAAAIGAIVIAYKTNFMGFADAVQAGLAKVQEFFAAAKQAVEFFAKVFQNSMGRGAHALQSFWNAVRRTLKGILGKDNPLYQFAQEVTRAVRAIKRGWDQGGIVGAFEAAKKRAEAAFTRIKEVVIEQFGNAVTWMREIGIPTLLGKFDDFKRDVLPKITEAITGLIDALVTNWPRVLMWLTEKVEALVVKGAEIVGAIVKGITDNWDSIGGWIKDNGWKVILAALALPMAVTTLGASIVVGILNGLREVWATQLYPWIRDTLGWKGWQALFSGAGTWLLDEGRAIVQGLQDSADKKWAEFTGNLSTKFNELAAQFSHAVSLLKDTGWNLIHGMWIGVTEKWEAFKSDLIAKGEALSGWLGNAGTWLKDTGIAIVQGLWDGVTEKWESFKADLIAKAEELPGWVKDILGIASPSQVFYEIGADTMEGWRKGIEDGIGKVRGTIALGGGPALGMAGAGARGGGATYNNRSISLTVNTQASDPNAVASAVMGRLYGAMDRVGAGVA